MKTLLSASGVSKFFIVVLTWAVILTLLVACIAQPGAVTPPSESTRLASGEPAKQPPESLPAQPTVATLPGTKDFTDTRPTSESGASLGASAFDLFIRIDEIPGESKDDKHKDWIEILSFSHGISQAAGSARTAGAALPAERVSSQDFSFVKSLDKATPKLALFCCNGNHLKEVVVELCRTGGDRQKFMEYRLEDVIISSFSSGGSGIDVVPTETLSLNFRKISWIYTEHDAAGRARGTVQTNWDLAANKGG